MAMVNLLWYSFFFFFQTRFELVLAMRIAPAKHGHYRFGNHGSLHVQTPTDAFPSVYDGDLRWATTGLFTAYCGRVGRRKARAGSSTLLLLPWRGIGLDASTLALF